MDTTSKSYESWWKSDEDQLLIKSITDNTYSNSSAGPLLNICIEVYGWTNEKAHRVLTGYKQFLYLKKKLQDFNKSKLIIEPSNIIDQMWVQHYSCSTYDDDCQLLCGGSVSRNGYDRLDTVSRNKRIETTKRMIEKTKFDQSIDKDIWSFDTLSSSSSSSAHGGNNSIVRVTSKGQKGGGEIDDDEEEMVKLIFRPHLSLSIHEAHYEIPSWESFVVVACVYAEDQGGIEFSHRFLRFIVDNKEIDTALTLKELGFVGTSQIIDVLPIHDGEGLGSIFTNTSNST